MNRTFTPGTRVYFGSNDGRTFSVVRQVGTDKLELLISAGRKGKQTRVVHVAKDDVPTTPVSVSSLASLAALRLPMGSTRGEPACSPYPGTTSSFRGDFCYTSNIPMSRSIQNILLTVALLTLAGLSYRYYKLYEENKALQGKVMGLQTTLATTEKNLAEMTENSQSLLDTLAAEQQKAGFLQEQASTYSLAVQRLSGTVMNLEKTYQDRPAASGEIFKGVFFE